jgi:hypothetical protein
MAMAVARPIPLSPPVISATFEFVGAAKPRQIFRLRSHLRFTAGLTTLFLGRIGADFHDGLLL